MIFAPTKNEWRNLCRRKNRDIFYLPLIYMIRSDLIMKVNNLTFFQVAYACKQLLCNLKKSSLTFPFSFAIMHIHGYGDSVPRVAHYIPQRGAVSGWKPPRVKGVKCGRAACGGNAARVCPLQQIQGGAKAQSKWNRADASLKDGVRFLLWGEYGKD